MDERQNVYEAPTLLEGDSLTGPELVVMGSPPKKRNKDEVQEVAPVTETMVDSSVERFDRRGIEPFELFTSEFGQNSVKFHCILLATIFQKIQDFSTFSKK